MAVQIKTALLSVYDKSGIAELAQHLAQFGITIYATGGTFRALQEVQVKAIPIDELTESPEMMDGRIKTLHPAVFAGILSRRDHNKDMETLKAHQLDPIDLVVSNLLPFSSAAEDEELTEEEKVVLELLKKESPQVLDTIKAASELSNKKWDKAIKGLRSKDQATVDKTDDGLFVKLV